MDYNKGWHSKKGSAHDLKDLELWQPIRGRQSHIFRSSLAPLLWGEQGAKDGPHGRCLDSSVLATLTLDAPDEAHSSQGDIQQDESP
ncbi:hypothetical protein AALO_G00139840 [Alosa alosa]|uniref:Uncharacterized protein n=1 Tax=Alosa alosa TaxID=278164 RepID=A0AAV6GML3_9TELE|nr:hypothetical protein AALO_G00139840 [Alosa alosa]